MQRHPRSFPRTWTPPGMYFYGMVPSEKPSKPRMSTLTGSYTGVIRHNNDVQGSAKTVSIGRLKPVNVLHVHTESASPPAVPSSVTTRSGRRLRFPDYLGVQRSHGGWWFGGCHRLPHPPSQDIASSTRTAVF